MCWTIEINLTCGEPSETGAPSGNSWTSEPGGKGGIKGRQKWAEGGHNPCRNSLWQFFREYKPLLRHLIVIIFHPYLPWFPSEFHLRIFFGHCHSHLFWEFRWKTCVTKCLGKHKMWGQSRIFRGGLPYCGKCCELLVKFILDSEINEHWAWWNQWIYWKQWN